MSPQAFPRRMALRETFLTLQQIMRHEQAVAMNAGTEKEKGLCTSLLPGTGVPFGGCL